MKFVKQSSLSSFYLAPNIQISLFMFFICLFEKKYFAKIRWTDGIGEVQKILHTQRLTKRLISNKQKINWTHISVQQSFLTYVTPLID